MTEVVFTQFIRYTYYELQTPGWKERKDILCAENPSTVCQRSDWMTQTLTEMVEEEEDEEIVMTVLFKDMALEEFWFKSWYEHNYPEQEWSWELRDEFATFLYSLNYVELMEMVGMDLICLK